MDKKNLVTLFESQMETLEERSYPKTIIETFQSQKEMALNKAIKTDILGGKIPFIPVTPRSYLGVYGLMLMVRKGEKRGCTNLDPNKITDAIKIPSKPYFIFDVENGKKMLGKSPEKAKKLIKEQKRFCLILEESIALCIHTCVLFDHFVDCAGSYYDGLDHILGVFQDIGGPKLCWHYAIRSDNQWGSASCDSRLIS